MTLTIEDGTQVANANSYVTLAEARDYAKARGVKLTDFDDVLEQELIKAMDYLEAQRDNFKGVKTSSTQPLQWPRCGAYVDGAVVEPTTIPNELKNAQIRIAMEIDAGINPMPTADGSAFVISEKVGQLETKYSEGVATSGVPIMRAVEALLAPLLRGAGGLRVERA